MACSGRALRRPWSADDVFTSTRGEHNYSCHTYTMAAGLDTLARRTYALLRKPTLEIQSVAKLAPRKILCSSGDRRIIQSLAGHLPMWKVLLGKVQMLDNDVASPRLLICRPWRDEPSLSVGKAIV